MQTSSSITTSFITILNQNLLQIRQTFPTEPPWGAAFHQIDNRLLSLALIPRNTFPPSSPLIRQLLEVYGQSDLERLEYLGDAVLELLVREYLYLQLEIPSLSDIHKLVELSVRNSVLSCLIGRKINCSGGDRKRCADMFEALLAAIYLGLGSQKVDHPLVGLHLWVENTFHLFSLIDQTIAQIERRPINQVGCISGITKVLGNGLRHQSLPVRMADGQYGAFKNEVLRNGALRNEALRNEALRNEALRNEALANEALANEEISESCHLERNACYSERDMCRNEQNICNTQLDICRIQRDAYQEQLGIEREKYNELKQENETLFLELQQLRRENNLLHRRNERYSVWDT